MAHQFQAAASASAGKGQGKMDNVGILNLLLGSGQKGQSKGGDGIPNSLRSFIDKMPDSRLNREEVHLHFDESAEVVPVIVPWKDFSKLLMKEKAVPLWISASDDYDESLRSSYEVASLLTADLKPSAKRALIETLRKFNQMYGVETRPVANRFRQSTASSSMLSIDPDCLPKEVLKFIKNRCPNADPGGAGTGGDDATHFYIGHSAGVVDTPNGPITINPVANTMDVDSGATGSNDPNPRMPFIPPRVDLPVPSQPVVIAPVEPVIAAVAPEPVPAPTIVMTPRGSARGSAHLLVGGSGNPRGKKAVRGKE